MKSRDTYHHGDLRTTLVAEGLRQLETSGSEAVSLRALAKAAGVSPNAPYRHFPDKSALMGALAAEGFRLFAEAIDLVPASPEPVTTLRAQGLAYLAFAADHPALYRLMFSPYGYSLHSEDCQREGDRAFGSMVVAASQAQAAGWKSGLDLSALVLAFWALLHGWAGLTNDRLVPPGIPVSTAEKALSVFFEGL